MRIPQRIDGLQPAGAATIGLHWMLIPADRIQHRVAYWKSENKTAMATIVVMVPTKAINSVNKTKACLEFEWY
jgi:hypothetical protein